jgi:hypothetical protein
MGPFVLPPVVRARPKTEECLLFEVQTWGTVRGTVQSVRCGRSLKIGVRDPAVRELGA